MMSKSYIKNLITGERFWLSTEKISLGRGKENNLSLDDGKISREHFHIIKKDSQWWAKDNKSTNGTYINGKQVVDNTLLTDGDILSAGDTRYVFCHENINKNTPSPSLSDLFDTQTNFSKTANIGVTDLLNHSSNNDDIFSKFYVFSQRIHGYLDKEKTMNAALFNLQKIMNADVVAYLKCPEKNHLDFYMSHYREGTIPELKLSKNLMLKSLNQQSGIMDSSHHKELGSLISIPMTSHEFDHGVFYLARSISYPAFEESDLKLITAMIQHLSLQLELISLTEKFTDSIEYNLSIRNSLPSALLVVSVSGIIQHLNPAATSIFSKDLHELLGHPLCEFPELTEVEKLLNSACASGTTVKRTEIIIQNDQNQPIPTGISCTPIRDNNGKILGAIANFRDLTEIKSLNEKIKRNQQLAAIGEMSAGIAHEIRNPLNSINGFVELIQNSLEIESDIYHFSEIVLSEVHRINTIVEDLLSLTRDTSYPLTTTAISDFCQNFSEISEIEVKQSGHQFKYVTTIKENISVSIHQDKLQQVLGNFIRNACEALEGQDNGLITLLISHENYENWGQGALKIAVTDNGCGIPDEICENVFNPFFSTKDNGTGLGLAVCQKIIVDMNGHIDLTSKIDKGSTFAITLPIV